MKSLAGAKGLLLAAALALVLAGSCAGKGGKKTVRNPTAPPPSGGISMQPAAPPPAGSVPTSPANTPGAKSAAAVFYPPATGMPSTPRYLNTQTPPLRILPSDFNLGTLQDLSSGEASGGTAPRALVKDLSAFLDGLIDPNRKSDNILAGREALVAAVVDGLPAQGQPGHPVSWRLRSVAVRNDEAVASIALFAAPIDESGPAKLPPRTDGVVHARLVDDSWLVEDISFDTAGLSADRPLPDPAWDPPAPGAVSSGAQAP